MEAIERRILYYQLPAGPPAPFSVWRDGLVERIARAAVDARISRLQRGNFSDSRPIGKGASENRIDFGPGYRVYYAVDGEAIILLHGGDKSTQQRDIEIARNYWTNYLERKSNAARSRLQNRPTKRSPKR
jgi:putative addiction module killer protein